MFEKEKDFEIELCKLLIEHGWEEILVNCSEEELIKNWADILFKNNCGKDSLNDCPLTEGEMGQILEQIRTLQTPVKLNGFINGKIISIKRDNPDDTLHFGKEISLKIYDRNEIAAGKSRYQIVRQPKFPTAGIKNDRRGDIMLLINGMPVFHIELKKSGIPVSQATNQIEKYAAEKVFTGLFSLVQIFVAMNPEETVYFANPGEGRFNSDFYFHWADFNNEPVNDWKSVVSKLLAIPMAHMLIGFYTVPDNTDGVLKVMRSYQYFAASRISDKVTKATWGVNNIHGGYIWHTTGSGKTMTSFKSAQLISNSKDADKVVFLMDRIELGTQSLKEYQNFSDDSEDVQATENTKVLIEKLKSDDPANTLIVTSIQKMSNINAESVNSAVIEKIARKRIVFIIDECHRSTFGDMLITVKKTFSGAMFFGFTGTPIHEENQIKNNTTTTVFGDELHRYSIADGIRDGNVLGFDPYRVSTYKDVDLRKVVALEQAKSKTVEEAISDPDKKKVYYHFMNDVKMCGFTADNGDYVKGIEDYIPNVQYNCDEHRKTVVSDIKNNWVTLSQNGKFHAIFATSSIPEAIKYYQLIKKEMPKINVTALFDPTIDNGDVATSAEKSAGLELVITDYNEKFNKNFQFATHASFKKDVANRLAHKNNYRGVEHKPQEQLHILIVVDQMLTGFDSKWINTLYLDKMLEYQNIIQAFSRTNRLFGYEKPFGTIRYYRRPYTMEQNIEKAVKLYSGDKPVGLFVQRLDENLKSMNKIFREIKELFTNAGLPDFDKMPEDTTVCGKFAVLFRELNEYLESAKIQGFVWEKQTYEFENGDVTVEFNETEYLVLAQRYKELFPKNPDNSPHSGDIPYEIKGYLTEIDTGKIDTDYMNSRFQKYLKLITITPNPSNEDVHNALKELHKTFAVLSSEEQRFAKIFLNDLECGDVVADDKKTLRDYITEYQVKEKDDRIQKLTDIFGLDKAILLAMLRSKLDEYNINEYGRLDKLKNSIDIEKAKEFFQKSGRKLKPFQVNIEIDKILRRFVLEGGFDVE